MSILQNYEAIKKSFGASKFADVEKFLKEHPEYFLSDVYYNKKVYKVFEQWQNKKG